MKHDAHTIPQQVKEFWAKDHSLRVSEGMFQKVREGALPGCPPVGYRNGRCSHEPKIVVDGELAPLVQKAFCLASEGRFSLRKILKIVTDEGLVSRNGKSMGISAFCGTLRNPFYTGRMRYEGIVVAGNHEALVDDELFERVIERMQKKRK